MTSDQVIPLLNPRDHEPVRGPARPPPPPDSPADSSSQSQSDLQDDLRLVALLIERNPSAWKEFIHRYERLIVSRVVATCSELGVQPAADLIEDCGADVLAGLFHNNLSGLREFQGRSRLSTWLSVVARRTTLARLQRLKRELANTCQTDSRFDMAAIPAAETDGLVDTSDRALLQACLRKLNATDREILALRFENKLSYAAIGKRLGVSENTVGPKLARARNRLKQLLSAEQGT